MRITERMRIFVLLLVMLSPAHGHAGPAEEAEREVSPSRQIFLDIAKQEGPIVPRRAAPEAYAVLDEIVTRLDPAQKAIGPGLAGVRNQIFLIDSPTENGFVMMLAGRKREKKQNLIFIYRGLIDHMWAQAAGNKQRFEKMLIGVIAHEMAHPIDLVVEDSLHKAKAESQLIEVRTDKDGTKMAKDAKLPRDSVMETLIAIERDDPKKMWYAPVLAGNSTHPESNVRQGAQRIWLTMDRFDAGDGEVAPLQHDVATVVSDLEKVHLPWDPLKLDRYGKWDLNRTLSALEKMLEKEIDERHTVPVIRFNFLATKLNEELARPGAAPTPAERRRIAKFYADYISTKHETAPFLEPGDYHQKKFISSKTARELAAEVPLYRTAEFRAEFLAELEKIKPANPKGIQEKARSDLYGRQRYNTENIRKTGIIPQEEIGKVMENYIQGAIQNRTKTGRWNYYGYELPDLWQGLTPEDELNFSHYTRTQVIPKLSPAERMQMTVSTITGDSKEFLFLENAEARNEFLKTASPDSLRKLREIAEAFWNDRELLVLADLVDRQTTTWEGIFQLLGKTTEQGNRELQETFKALTRSPRYAKLLPLIAEKLGKDLNLYTIRSRPWLDPSLYDFALGKFAPGFAGSPELEKLAGSLATKILIEDPNGYLFEQARRELAEALKQNPAISAAKLTEAQQGIYLKLFGEKPEGLMEEPKLARTIADSPLSPARKKKLLRDLFLKYKVAEDNMNYSGFNFVHWNGNRDEKAEVKEILAVLTEQKVLSAPSAILEEGVKAQKFFGTKLEDNGVQEAHFESMANYADNLAEELRGIRALPAAEKTARLFEFTRRVFDPWEFGHYSAHGNTANRMFLRDMKRDIIAEAQTLPLAPGEKLKLFQMLTAAGHGRETDVYFKAIKSMLPAAQLQEILESGRLESARLKVETLAKLQVTAVDKLAKFPNAEGFDALIKEVTRLIPDSSAFKDDYLESLVWKLRIDDPAVLHKVELLKSTSWKNANPKSINFASFFSEHLKDFPPEGRADLIQYFRDPKEHEFPASLDQELKRYSRFGRYIHSSEDEQFEAYQKMRDSLETFAHELKREERVPILDNLLNDPKRSIHDAAYQKELINRYLFPAGSKEEKALLVYLNKVADPFERSISLAYLLSVSGEEVSSILPIFELHQAVGKKTGQLAATWKIFENPQINNDLQSLKDRARPLTKFEIIQLLRERMPEQEFAKIRVNKILGAASLKTVVLVDLPEGKQAVIALRYPNVEGPIRSNLIRADKFLSAMASEEAHPAAPLMKQFIASAGEQLVDELDFLHEAAYLDTAADFFESMNAKMDMKGWKFTVPRLKDGYSRRSDLLVMEPGHGVTFNEITDAAAKKQAGELIVESSLRGLFEEGIFDPDRHRGNFLIDWKDKTIHPIDFGQLQEAEVIKGAFSSDERLKTALLLWAVDSGDSKEALKQALALSGNSGLSSAKLTELEKAVAGRFAQAKDFDSRLLALTGVLGEHEVPMGARFLAGTLKGLMILKEEGYVDANEFRQMLRDRVKAVLKEKWPQALKPTIRNAYTSCKQGFSRLLKH